MKNKFLTLLFAFVPGAAQMYQAYMKRGLSLISMFCAASLCCYILTPLGAAMMLIVWMYSFFDALNLRAQIGAGSAPADDYLPHLDRDSGKMRILAGESPRLLGWCLIAAGAILFYNQVLMSTLGDIVWRWGEKSPLFRAIYLVLESLPEIVVCVALIVCGVWLVREPRGAKPANAPKKKRNLLEELREYRAARQAAPETAPAAPGETGDIELIVEDPNPAENSGDGGQQR